MASAVNRLIWHTEHPARRPSVSKRHSGQSPHMAPSYGVDELEGIMAVEVPMICARAAATVCWYSVVTMLHTAPLAGIELVSSTEPTEPTQLFSITNPKLSNRTVKSPTLRPNTSDALISTTN